MRADVATGRSFAAAPAGATIAAAVAVALVAACTPPRGATATATAPHRRAHRTITARDRAMVQGTAGMIVIPAGRFTMGCDPSTDPLCEPDETPAHAVNVDSFRIDRTEVTERDYAMCVDDHVCSAPYGGPTPWEGKACVGHFTPEATPDLPVSCVSWAQAAAFCAWAGKRLPNESEWEKAARGTDARTWPWGETPPPDCGATSSGTEGCGEASVGSRPGDRSPYGVLDMGGNVWEWTGSWYAADLYRNDELGAGSRSPDSGEFRVVRGCEFNAAHASRRDWRTANRFALAPQHVSVRLGFRCARP